MIWSVIWTTYYVLYRIYGPDAHREIVYIPIIRPSSAMWYAQHSKELGGEIAHWCRIEANTTTILRDNSWAGIFALHYTGEANNSSALLFVINDGTITQLGNDPWWKSRYTLSIDSEGLKITSTMSQTSFMYIEDIWVPQKW